VTTVGTLLFPGFQLLDVFGPLEMLGALPGTYDLEMVAETVGGIASNQGPRAIADVSLADAKPYDILLIPGGRGTRRQVDNPALIAWITAQAQKARFVATVCTGAALLARTGLLDGRKATSNKAAFGWVMEQGPKVLWQPRARWVVDGKFFTSAGVSAGIDMTLGLISTLDGPEAARRAAEQAEYRWHNDPTDDPFGARLSRAGG
jgi:putative intracellular protease/amidase